MQMVGDSIQDQHTFEFYLSAFLLRNNVYELTHIFHSQNIRIDTYYAGEPSPSWIMKGCYVSKADVTKCGFMEPNYTVSCSA